MVNKDDYYALSNTATNMSPDNHFKKPFYIETSRLHGQTLSSAYFICLGIASLLPWNTILSTLDYYDAKFPDGQVNFYFPAAYSTTIILIKLLMVWFKDTISLNTRVAVCLGFQIVLMCLLPITASVLSNSSSGYWIVLLILVLLGSVNQISYASATGLAGYFPSKYISNMMTGTGFGGIASNSLRVIAIICFRDEGKESYLMDMFTQYGVTAVFLVFCIVLHYRFVETEYAQEEINKHTIETGFDAYVSEEFPLLKSVKKNHMKDIKNSLWKLWVTFKNVKTLAIFMIIIYIQTLMLYPGVMLKQDIPNMDLAWKVVLLQMVYNIFDTVGKYLTENRGLLNRRVIYYLILARFIFYFTFIAEAISKDAPILDDIWFTLLNIALFGVTNGFTTTALFIFGPEQLEGQDKEIVGFLLLNCLTFGVMAGSFLALPLSNL